MAKEFMEFDVVIVGAGPAGLTAACKIMQLAEHHQQALSVCVVEKGAEIGAHVLSGAVLETKALDELFPDWKAREAPITTKVSKDELYFFANEQQAIKLPLFIAPQTMRNEGNYIVSMGNVCRWLGEQAEALGVEIFPGFPAANIYYREDGSVGGVITADMGVNKDHQPKESFVEGMILKAKYTLFAEGCRGHLGKALVQRFALDNNLSPQHYALGFKEIWEVPEKDHQPGLVIHSAGWPLDHESSGGGFLYHGENNQVYVGMIIDLNYVNPSFSPFDEFQRFKQQNQIKQHLIKGKRIAYGARSLAKGGFYSLPKMTFPGGLLIGCDAGLINFSKIKGNHTAMKSGLLAAESVFEALQKGEHYQELHTFTQAFEQSWLYQELYESRNFGGAIKSLGVLLGGFYNSVDQNVFSGKLPFRFIDKTPDHLTLKPYQQCDVKHYEKPDNQISFDRLSSVYLSNTQHEENQPCHLVLENNALFETVNWAIYNEPAQLYCPAGVYEVADGINQEKQLVINSANCLHCKTCDIKDPKQNITWYPPEGGGGPNYPNL